MKSRSKQLIVITLISLSLVGCIKKTSGIVSPWEQANVYLASLGQLNNDIAKGIIAVQQTGVVSAKQVLPILSYQEQVARDHMALENIFQAGLSSASGRSVEVNALLNEISKQGSALIASGGLNIKNPRSQQLFTQDLQGLVSLTSIVLTSYDKAKGAN